MSHFDLFFFNPFILYSAWVPTKDKTQAFKKDFDILMHTIKGLAVSRSLNSHPRCNERTELAENSWRSPNCRHCQSGATAHLTASAGTCTSNRDYTKECILPINTTRETRALPGLHGFYKEIPWVISASWSHDHKWHCHKWMRDSWRPWSCPG